MSRYVALEVRRTQEGLPTLIAGVAFNVVVDSHVLIQGTNQREGRSALVTDVRALTAMLADVVGDKSCCLSKLLTALRAQIRLLSRVDPHMNLQVSLAGDFHATKVTRDTLVWVDRSSAARSVREQLMRVPEVFSLGNVLKLHGRF